MSKRIEYDAVTKRWFKKHPDAQTTVMQCEQCGLYYKPELGHACKKAKKEKPVTLGKVIEKKLAEERIDFDELHKELSKTCVLQKETRVCELCKQEHPIIVVDYGGVIAPVPRNNHFGMTVHDMVSNNTTSYYCTNLCSVCAESILNHIKSLEVI